MADGTPDSPGTRAPESSTELSNASDNSSIDDANDLNLDLKSKSPRRVKVYLLRGEDWLDNGTGYCMGQVDSKLKKPYFIVRNELDSDDIILKSFLEGSIQYQRQQETLIVWTDLSGKDLALSFQENEGCADLCDFIVKVQQQSLSPMISLYYVLSTMQETNGDGPREITELVTGPITYPPTKPSKRCLDDVLDIINQGSNSQYTRSHIVRFLVEENYLQSLFEIFRKAEDERDLPTLHQLSDIVKILLVYNEPTFLDELLVSEQNVLGFVGILEYDRDYPKFKACHREYLLDESKFKSVVDIPLPPQAANSEMSIFRRDFILNYLKNVVLARNLDDQTLNTLSSMIYNNQMDIISFLKDSKANGDLLTRLFALYDLNDDESLLQRKRDGIKMLHQYVLVTKGHQASLRPDFYSALVDSGLFKMVKFALRDSDSNIRVVGTELLVTIIEQDVSLVNSPTIEEHVDELDPPVHEHRMEDSDDASHDNSEPLGINLESEMSLTLVLGQLLLEDKNPGLKIQAYEAIKTLLTSASASESCNDMVDDPEQKSRELNASSHSRRHFVAFYEQVAPVLFRDFIDLASEDEQKCAEAEEKIRNDPILYQHLCDLISFCCREHEPSICRPFFFNNSILKGILRILRTKLKITLKLGVMRCFKSIILLNDYPFCRHIIDNNLFKDYFEFFGMVANENSLANSLCLDLLEIIIRRSLGKNFRQLAMHIYNDYKTFLETQIDYVSTGRDLMLTVESHVQLLNDPTATSVDAEPENYTDNPSSPIRKGEEGDEEEEDEEEEVQGNGNHNNMFENIQKEISGTKRGNEEREDGEVFGGSEENSEANGTSRKRVSISIPEDQVLDQNRTLNQSVTT